MTDDIDYEALDTRLAGQFRPVGSGQAAVGAEASAVGRDFLLREYGSEGALGDALGVRRGRPRVGEARGASATLRGRVSDEDYAAFKRLEEQTGRSQSELVREAVHQLLVQHRLVS